MATDKLIDSEEDAGRVMGEILLSQRITGEIDPELMEALEEWMELHPETREVYDQLTNPLEYSPLMDRFKGIKEPSAAGFLELVSDIEHSNELYSRRRRIPTRVYYLSGIAASLLIAFSLFVVKHLSPSLPQQVAAIQDLAPGTNKAVLTLANGSTVNLDSAHSGLTLQQGQTRVVNQAGGQLAYQGEDNSNTAILYNTITTGRGGQYRLVLSDGTKVWLDAASSLKYPTAFTGSSREVVLTGQGYFEVAHHREPFIVHTAGVDVQDLGTAFNINAYPDEDGIKTTLLEGSVKVKSVNTDVILKPGQQARALSSGGGLQVMDDVDTDEAVAWKDGRFQFTGVAFSTVLQYLSRWYDVRIIDKTGIASQHVVITLPRNEPLSAFMRSLELTHKLTYQITDNGKTLVISP